MAIGKLLIANRGEIALRIIRTCREMGISTVAVYSTVDRTALHVQLADEAVCVGDPPSSRSYLNIPNIIAAATSRGADAIHPGYGFLAENDRFAEICNAHGLTFVGPSPESIREMGDKSTAKSTMQRVGVPTIPGSEGLLDTPEEAAQLAETIGYPVMIKATAGGGGRGMRLVRPVTEVVTGIDLIAEQLRIAAGEPLRLRQEDIQLRGHAIECRINAEDPRHNFRPAPGTITGWLPPGGPGVRFDSHVYTGYEIPPFYDSLIGKLIVWGEDRPAALKRMRRALSECAVIGVPTTIEFHLALLDRPEFQRGEVHTKFVEMEMLKPGAGLNATTG
ncbi:MAG: hypothetical protein EB123_02785 [Synechococcaceae bacterium WBB_32_011]|nr:hypothetical protein [Synechococcaceae bacterium WBB_32_011]